MKSLSYFSLALLFALVMPGCSDDNNDDGGSGGGGSTPTATLTITSNDGTWTTSEVKVYDQANSLISFEADSDEGGSMFFGFFFDGADSYTFETSGFGNWFASMDGMTNYATTFADPGSGAFNVTDHDTQSDRISGGIDLMIPEFNNPSNMLQITGSFEDVPIVPLTDIVQDVDLQIDGVAFDHDYVVTQISGLEVYIHAIKDVNERIVIRLARAAIESGQSYPNGFSTSVGVTYYNGTNSWTELQGGMMDIDEHFAGAFPDEDGMTSGIFVFDLGDNNGGSKTFSGNFDVSYGF